MKAYKAIEGTETYKKYGDDIITSLIVEQDGLSSEVRAATADELIDAIGDEPDWETGLVEMLCELVGINPDDYPSDSNAYDAAVIINNQIKYDKRMRQD